MADPHDATAHISGGVAPSHTHASHTGIGTGDHHARDHGDAEHPVMGRMVLVRKTADETVSLSSTSQNDDHLFFSIAANEVWAFSISIVFQSTTVGDFKYQIGAPSGATGYVQRSDLSSTSGVTALNADSASVSGTTGSDINLPLLGIVANSTTAGTVQLKWASNTVDVDTTVRANSFLLAHRIA